MQTNALQILIPEGNPNGLKVISISGWSGNCFICPRQSVHELKKRPNITEPALYLLFGTDAETDEKLVYIGESESFITRIISHDSHKDFWDVAVVFSGELNRAHVKYLEHKATNLAIQAKRMVVQNEQRPKENILSEFDLVAVDKYFQNAEFILKVFGYQVFDSVAESVTTSQFYYLKTDGADAKAQLLSDGTVNILKGSLARIKEANSFRGWSQAARKIFLEDGTLVDSGDGISYIYTKDVLFKSPSAAASTTTGRPTNGWTTWKDESGNTLDENLRK